MQPLRRRGSTLTVLNSQPDDLPFVKGDIIILEEEINADWWRGSCGESTLFVYAFPVLTVTLQRDAVEYSPRT